MTSLHDGSDMELEANLGFYAHIQTPRKIHFTSVGGRNKWTCGSSEAFLDLNRETPIQTPSQYKGHNSHFAFEFYLLQKKNLQPKYLL